jgi:hypothetical protein
VCGVYLGELSFMRYRLFKATRLIHSVQQLKIGITSLDEVRQLSDQYGGRFYQDEGPIVLPPNGASYVLNVWSPYLLIRDNAFPMLGPGLRVWLVSATLGVEGNHLSRVSLRIIVKRSDNLDLESEVSVTTRNLAAPEEVSYYVGEPHVTGSPTEALQAELRPSASFVERTKAFDINTNCLTSFRECRHVCEVSPSAWNDLGEHRLRYDDGREKVIDAECRQTLSKTK